MQYIKR